MTPDERKALSERRRIGRAEELKRVSEESPYLEEPLAAAYLHVKRGTLRNWRVAGTGPRFRQHGSRILYHQLDLDSWSESNARTCTLPRQPKVAAPTA